MGYIPKRILMFRAKHEKLGGLPAFPVRAGGTTKVAEEWVAMANRKAEYYALPHEDRVNFWNHYDPKSAEGAETRGVALDNPPREGFRIVDAEQRGEGGRAWKALTPDGDLVDMREDVFLPILLQRGLPPGGVIQGTFQWCQNGSQLRLEEVGSEAHKKYITEDEYLKKKDAPKGPQKPGTKDLAVGQVFQSSLGSVVYLGKATWDGKPYRAWAKRDELSQNMRGHKHPRLKVLISSAIPALRERLEGLDEDETAHLLKVKGRVCAIRYWSGMLAAKRDVGSDFPTPWLAPVITDTSEFVETTAKFVWGKDA